MRRSMLSAFLIIVLCLFSVTNTASGQTSAQSTYASSHQITFRVDPTATMEIIGASKNTVYLRIRANTSWALTGFSKKAVAITISGSKTGDAGKQFELDKKLTYTVACP